MPKRTRKPHAAPRRPPAAQTGKPQRVPDATVIVLAALGLLITAYLTALAWFGGPAVLCGEGSGCDIVRQSRWSSLLGLPIALWGFAVYAAIGLVAWRMPARLKRWRRLWLLALLGTAVSVYLTTVAVFTLDALCPWCLASLAVITTILILLTFRRPESAPGMPWPHWLGRGAVVALVVVGGLHLWYSDLLKHPDTPRLTALAAHLDATGARYYGAWWCPDCLEQKRLFRGGAERLPFVECSSGGRGSPMTLRCRDLGIDSYPTWIIEGRRHTGAVAPRDLARFTGFDWDGYANR